MMVPAGMVTQPMDQEDHPLWFPGRRPFACKKRLPLRVWYVKLSYLHDVKVAKLQSNSHFCQRKENASHIISFCDKTITFEALQF